jgi:predicted porin
MKKNLLALALLGASASAAHAQSSVTIYGTVDAGVSKTSNATTAVGRRDNNRLGFKGVEDLGSGLKALFQLEIRYDPDTGALEGGTRPLFQGQSRVGLQGAFGTVRLGRGLTALQETSLGFEPWSGMPTPAGFQTDLQVAGYTSDPLSAPGNSRNRFSNALFYNSPVWGGFQINGTVASREANGGAAIIGLGTAAAPQFPANSEASAAPFSVSATYNVAPFGAFAAYERNAIETKIWSVGASFNPITDLRLMATYQKQDEGETRLTNENTKAWVLGANYNYGPGKILAGYGQKTPDNVTKTKQFSLGYEYNLSKRTYLYVDASRKKVASSTNFYDIGVHHNF